MYHSNCIIVGSSMYCCSSNIIITIIIHSQTDDEEDDCCCNNNKLNVHNNIPSERCISTLNPFSSWLGTAIGIFYARHIQWAASTFYTCKSSEQIAINILAQKLESMVSRKKSLSQFRVSWIFFVFEIKNKFCYKIDKIL